MAAIFAAAGDQETVLIERTPDGGRKILISGGGRCNVLPSRADESRFVTASAPRAMQRMLRSWPLREQIPFFENELGIPLAEEPESAKLFPSSNRARDVRDALLALARRRGVELMMDTLVTGLAPTAEGWSIERAGAPPIEAHKVIVATGGLSVPKSGSDGLGLSIPREARPHDSPDLSRADSPDRARVALHVAGGPLSARDDHGPQRRTECLRGGRLFFTHRGYSGPSVLDVSHVAVRTSEDGAAPARLTVRWSRLDEKAWHKALEPGPRTVVGVLRSELPDRLAGALCVAAGVDPSRPLAQLRREERIRLVDMLVRGELPWSGHEGYAKAEVTGGGVSLAEVDPATMESRKLPGLFLCGEILDAFGPIGGFNFQWAWATGRAAGIAAAEKRSAPLPNGRGAPCRSLVSDEC